MFDVNKGAVANTTPVLPMDYSHMDIEDIHSPQIRALPGITGELARRRSAQTSAPVQGAMF
jgi:hypothetical protein